MKIYFTSDTHFGAERTRQFSRRPFASTQIMDKNLIKNWNKVVQKDDIVYHLGDFGDFNNLKYLNGNVILILGNYEKDIMKNNYQNDLKAFSTFLKSLGFKEVYKDGHEIQLKSDDKTFDIYLTHKPSDCKPNQFNLFGHIHEKNFIKRFGLNVGVDCHHFCPASTETVLFYKNAIENYYDDEVFM